MWNRCGVNRHAVVHSLLKLIVRADLMWPFWDADKSKTLNSIMGEN